MLEPVNLINEKWFFKEDIGSPFFGTDHPTYEIYVPDNENQGQYHSIAVGLTKELANHIIDNHNAWFGFKSLSDGIQDFFDGVNRSLEEAKIKLEEMKQV